VLIWHCIDLCLHSYMVTLHLDRGGTMPLSGSVQKRPSFAFVMKAMYIVGQLYCAIP
jgi:hypothetical protein